MPSSVEMLKLLESNLFRWRKCVGEFEFKRTTIPARCPDSRDAARYLDVKGPRKVLTSQELDSDAQTNFKKSCPLFSFREHCSKAKGTRYNYIQGIIADFDSLPDGYESYEDFANKLTARHPDAFVFRSVRGKVKAIWFVKAYCKKINTMEAVGFLRTRIPDLISDTDTSESGLTLSYMDAAAIEAFQAFSARWGQDDSFLCDLPKSERVDFENRKSNHKYREAPPEAVSPALEEQIQMLACSLRQKNVVAFRQLFAILVGCRNLTTDAGFGLSTSCIARQIGVTDVTVSVWLKTLCQLGFLKWTGNAYVPCKIAKVYIAMKPTLVNSINAHAATLEAPKGPLTSLTDVVAKAHAELGSSNEFRCRAAFFAAINGYSVEELIETVGACVPGIFTDRTSTGRNQRRRELATAYKSALNKFVLGNRLRKA